MTEDQNSSRVDRIGQSQLSSSLDLPIPDPVDLPDHFENWWSTSRYRDRPAERYSERKQLAWEAYYAASKAAIPEPKNLEWVENPNKATSFDGFGIVRVLDGMSIGMCFATIIESDDGYFTLLSDVSSGRYPSLEQAQSLAQADLRARFAKAFSPKQ
jgi:hypothetical protein